MWKGLSVDILIMISGKSHVYLKYVKYQVSLYERKYVLRALLYDQIVPSKCPANHKYVFKTQFPNSYDVFMVTYKRS